MSSPLDSSPGEMVSPPPAALSASPHHHASSSNLSLSSPSASSSSSGHGVSTARLEQIRSHITSACHVTQPEEGTDGNVFVHVIDGQGEFSCTPNDLTYLVLHSSTRVSDYSVVGIMGCQSTGKSTLLNLLFGTKFQEMDSSKGRSQTTKGVWMDSGSKRRDLVIMDLEGTDSGERGEDRTTFERQTSLYALAVAEVLLINMWEHDIGRYTASNYGILKTVFEVNLQLFDTQNKTILMFIIRDHIEEDTPMTQLQVKLEKEIQKIWTEIRKPAKFETTPVEDLFELRFFALPHMKLQKAEFVTRVNALRNQFTSPSDADYLFSSKFHGKKAVPADGFGVYMEQCWTAIQSNKELNLPTQKEMLATFRCDEIINQLYRDTFVQELAQLKQKASEQLIADEYATIINPLLSSILTEYCTSTQHYHPEIVETKKLEFLKKMLRELEELFLQQARKFITAQMMAVFKKELNDQLALSAGSGGMSSPVPAKDGAKKDSSHDAPNANFMAACQLAREKALKEYAEVELNKFQLSVLQPETAKQIGLEEQNHAVLVSTWSTAVKKIEEELSHSIDTSITQERSTQLKKLSRHLDKMFQAQLSQPLNTILKKANPLNMWSEVGKLYRQIYDSTIRKYVMEQVLPSYQATAEERTLYEAQSETQLSSLFRSIVNQRADTIEVYMRSKFDKLFRSDPSGRVRTWTNDENIIELFKHARDEALKQLDLFAIFRLDEYKDEKSEANRIVAEQEAEAAKPKLQRGKSIKKIALEETKEKEQNEIDEEEEEKIGLTTIDYSTVDAANIILDPTERLKKESTFRFEIESARREAEMAQAQNASRTRVPLWMIGLVCFLGMDEIMSVLRNPLLLFLLVVVGGSAYAAHQVGALMPMISVAKTTIAHISAQLQSNVNPKAVSSSSATVPSSRPLMSRAPSLAKSHTDSSPRHSRTGSRSGAAGVNELEMTAIVPSANDDGEDEQDAISETAAIKRRIQQRKGATL